MDHTWAEDDIPLILDILSQAKMTFWAGCGADDDYAIRLWNPGAEEIYGHSRSDALGRSYIDLFVNPRERNRAIEDHARIIQSGEIYEWDWAADDLTSDNQVRTMLTHCFRVRDPKDGKWLLAEMGVDISDFTRATQQLRMLREDDFERREMTLAYAVGEIGSAVAQVGVEGSARSVAEKVFAAARQAVSGVGRCTAWLVDGSGTERIDEGDLSTGAAFMEEEAFSTVIATGEPIFFDTSDMESKGTALSIAGRRGRKRSFAVLPLRTFHSNQLGAMGVSLTSGKPLLKRDRDRLESVAAFAGPLLSVARELQRTREARVRRLEVQAKQNVYRSVLHNIGNDVFELRGLVDSIVKPEQRTDIPGDIRGLLTALGTKSEKLNSFLADLKRDLESEDSPEAVSVLEAATDLKFRLRIDHPNVQVAVDATPEYAVQVVRVWLNHILENVVANAVQILEEWVGGGNVTIRAQGGPDGRTEIHIEDDGPGVDTTIATNLFERGVTRRPGGTGEGLAIAREFAIRSGGDIELLPTRSDTLGGAHFRITLPTAILA